MGLFSSSRSSSTNVSNVHTNNVSAPSNDGVVISGSENSTVHITDRGAVASALDVVRRSNEDSLEFARRVGADVSESVRRVNADSLDTVRRTTSEAFEFAEKMGGRALGLGNDAMESVSDSVSRSIGAMTAGTRAVLAGNDRQIAAISSLAESVSVGDRETSAKLAMMMLAVVGIMIVIIVFMVLR